MSKRKEQEKLTAQTNHDDARKLSLAHLDRAVAHVKATPIAKTGIKK